MALDVKWLSDLVTNPLSLIYGFLNPQYMKVLGSVFTNPLTNAALSGDLTEQQQAQWEQFDKDTKAQIESALGLAEERVGGAEDIYKGGFGDAFKAYQMGFGPAERALQGGYEGAGDIFEQLPGMTQQNRLDFLQQFGETGEELQRGYGDRYRFAEEELKGYGEQQKADIDRYYEEQMSDMRMDLARRGLSSASIESGLANRITEGRSAEQRRLAEDLTRGRIDVLGGLSGEQLGAEERWGLAESAYDAAMRGDVLGAQQLAADYRERAGTAMSNLYGQNAVNVGNMFGQAGRDLTDIYRGTTGDWLNTITGINYAPPQQTQVPYQLGWGSAQRAQAPSSSAGLLGGGMNTLGDIISAFLMSSGGGMGGAGGVGLGAGMSGGMMPFSDRNLKTDIEPVDGKAILKGVENLPVARWRYESALSVALGADQPHIGPMAQDFQEQFGIGDGTTIHMIDAIGVLFAAVKELARKVNANGP